MLVFLSPPSNFRQAGVNTLLMAVANMVSSTQQKLEKVYIVPLPFSMKTPLVYMTECIFYALKTQHESCLLTSATLALWKEQDFGVLTPPLFLSVMPT